jgi:hypothetical protein
VSISGNEPEPGPLGLTQIALEPFERLLARTNVPVGGDDRRERVRNPPAGVVLLELSDRGL